MSDLELLIEVFGDHFNAGSPVSGKVHLKALKSLNIMKLTLTVRVLEEIKIYDKNQVRTVTHVFYNAPYLISKDFSLKKNEILIKDFEVVLPLDKPGTYHGQNASCKWLLVAVVQYGNNKKAEKTVELFVYSPFYL